MENGLSGKSLKWKDQMCEGNQEFKLQMLDKYVEKALWISLLRLKFMENVSLECKYYSHENINGI